MKRRVLSLLLALTLCVSLLPVSAMAENAAVSPSPTAAAAAPAEAKKDEPAPNKDGGNGRTQDDTSSGGSNKADKGRAAGAGETGGEEDSGLSNNSTGGGVVVPGTPAEGGGVYVPVRTEIWCTNMPDSIGRGYDGTTDGNTISFFSLSFADSENNAYTLYEGKDFTADKTFASAEAGTHDVTVTIKLIGEAADTYTLKAGTETFTIDGTIRKAVPNLTVSLSRETCTTYEELLPLLRIDGVQENAAVAYYYTQFKNSIYDEDLARLNIEIDGTTTVSETGTYYIFARTAETKNYEAGTSAPAAFTVSNDAASVVSADGTETKYPALSNALDATGTEDTVRLLMDIGGSFIISKSVTLDLNGKNWNGTAAIYSGGTLTLTGSGTVNTVTLGGKLDVQNDGVKVNTLDVTSAPSPAMSLKHGAFGAITIADNISIAAYDLLADGYAFCGADGAVQNGEVKSLTNVTVMPHEHTIDDNGKCACGAACLHPDWKNGVCTSCGKTCVHADIDTSANTCNTCGAELTASLTANGSTTYYVGLADALNAAGKSGSNTCTVTLLKNAGVTGIDGKGDVSIIDALIAPGHGSSDRVLDLNGYNITGGGKIDVGNPGDEGCLTVTGVGEIDTTINVENGRLTLSAFAGTIDTVIINYGSLSNDAGTAWRIGTLYLENTQSSGVLRGGTIGKIEAGSEETTARKLLASGYVFKNADGSYADMAASANSLTEVTVVKCDHNGTNGFDINSTACPYCGVPAVAYTQLNLPESAGNPWRNFADLQIALDSDRDGGSTIRLLTDVSGEYTVNGTTYTGLDLNGYSINGTVYVTGGGKNTTFSNSKSTGTVGAVVASAGAKLAGSGAPAVIGTLKLADGATWANILDQPQSRGYKVYANYHDLNTYMWYAPADVTGTVLNSVVINTLPITSHTLTLKVNGKNVSSVERGTTVQLCAYCNTSGASVAFYVGKQEGSGYNYAQLSGDKVEYKKIGTTWYYVAEYTFTESGKYDIYFTAAKDGYLVSSNNKNLTVTKASIPADAITAPTANTLTYNGQPQELVTAGSVDAKYGTIQYSLYRATGFSTGIPQKTDAGTYRVYYKVIGSSEYKDSAVQSLTVTIGPKKLYLVNATLAEKIYDGTADAVITEAIFAGLVDGDTLTIGTDYTAVGEFADGITGNIDANAGDGKMASVTVKLTGNVKNYMLNSGDSSTLGMYGCIIKKAPAPTATPGELYVYNDLAKTYEVELPALPTLESPKTYGNISYNWPGSDLSTSYNYGGIELKPGKLSLPILKNPTNVEGRIGTAYVTVVTDNYEDFKLEINVFAKNRIEPTVNAPQASDITYGQPLSESTLSFASNGAYDPTTGAAVKGELRWKDGSTVPGINADDNWYAWEFVPAGEYDGKYAIVTGDVYVKVNPAALTGVSVEQAGTLTYNGEPQTAKVNAAATAVNGQQVVFTYSAAENGAYSAAVPAFTDAGTYTVYYKANSTGHTEATGSFTVTIARMEIARTTFVKTISKTYDGTAVFALEAAEKAGCLKFYDAHNQEISVPTDAYEISDVRAVAMNTEGIYVDSPEAGSKSVIQHTVKLTNDNYVLHHPDFNPTDEWTCRDHGSATVTITKAGTPAAENGALTVTNGLHKTYSFDLSTLLPSLADPCEYGTVVYGAPAANLGVGTFVTLVNSKTGALTLEVVDRNSTDEGPFGTITVTVTTANYADITLTINVSAVNKTVPAPDGEVSAGSITYGQTLNESSITGRMKDPATGAEVTGTFAWKNGTVKPIAGSYRAEWTFTPDAPEYAAAAGIVSVKVNRKDITGATVTLKSDSAVFDGTEKRPELESVVLDGVTLVNGQDYDYVYVYAHGTDVGQYALTVVGYNNYEGEATVYFSITPRTVTAPSVTVSGAPFVYIGSAITPEVTVTDDLGHVIDPKEYSVSYKDNTNAGTATITITDNNGGNYIVSGGTTFTIGKAPSGIQTAPAAKTGLVYNGTEQELITAGTAAGGTMKYRLGATGAFGAAVPKAVNAGEYTVYYYVEGDANHHDQAVQSVTVTVAKAPVTIKAHDKAIYLGLAAPSLADPKAGTDYTITGLLNGDTLSGITVHLAYPATPNTARVSTTEIVLTVTGEDARYAVTTENGTLTVSNRFFDTTVEPSENGDITSDTGKSTVEGGDQTWRITPKPGYATADVIVDGKHVGPVSEWTFKNVREKHTIEAVFMPVTGNPQNGVDVGN